MTVKTYRAKNLFEAFALIRAELGMNATLLRTREIRRRRLFGLLPAEVTLEVVATNEIIDDSYNSSDSSDSTQFVSQPVSQPVLQPALSRGLVCGGTVENTSSENTRDKNTTEVNAVSAVCEVASEPEPSESFWNMIPDRKNDFQASNALDTVPFRPRLTEHYTYSTCVAEPELPFLSSVSPVLPVSSVTENSFRAETPTCDSRLLFGGGSGFFQQVANLSKSEPTIITPQFRDALLQIYSKLQTADMDDHSTMELLKRLREDALLYAATGKRTPNADFSFLERKLQELVSQEIQTAGPIQMMPGKRRTVALVGPTGVGKTTTIAKLAIDYRQKRNCQVGLITLDLSRMGAVEQLQTFADVIGIPMLCASTRQQMRDAIARMVDFDLLLIDTAGQSRAGEMTLQEMRMLFDVADVEDVMLVLSSTTRTRVLQQTVDAFSSVGTTSLILTKLDEALGLGNLFPLLQTTPLPVSYVTNGQKVPDDFEVANRERLARYILGDL